MGFARAFAAANPILGPQIPLVQNEHLPYIEPVRLATGWRESDAQARL